MSLPAFREDGWLPAGHHTATWDEIVVAFGGTSGSRRSTLTNALIELRDALRANNVSGSLLFDGSYVSTKMEPGDFDVLLIGPTDIQLSKEAEPNLSRLLDAEIAEKDRGYSLLFVSQVSPVLDLLKTLWDLSKEGIVKGVVEVQI